MAPAITKPQGRHICNAVDFKNASLPVHDSSSIGRMGSTQALNPASASLYVLMPNLQSPAITTVWNVPNLLTTVRFFLALAVVPLIDWHWYMSATVVFLIAVSTDWMDGYYARRYGQVTKLGRIFDPFVDKIIICGAFIALVAIEGSGVAAWMAIVVVGRELLVTSLRGIIEGAGGDFSASSLGKWKMVLQCVAVVAVLLCLVVVTPDYWLDLIRNVSLWVATGLTVYSGFDYVLAAARVLRSGEGAA